MQKLTNFFDKNTVMYHNRYANSDALRDEQRQQRRRIKRLQWLFILLLLLGYVTASLAQAPIDNTFNNKSDFNPTIKDAVKLSDLPEIKDSVKRIDNIKYSITSKPVDNKYEVQGIEAAKMANEPLSKLYRSLIKAGFGTYTTPYFEAWVNSLRSRDMAYGIHYKHQSSMSHLRDVGYSGYSDNEAEIFGKKFYKKHTLYGDFNYKRNRVYYYGYDTSLNDVSKSYIKQYYQIFEPKLRLQSHYTDSTHLNHDISLAYYNLTDNYKVAENNVKLGALLNTYINKERLFVNVDLDYYNNKMPKDTFNNFIAKVNPYFAAHGEKWKVDIGLTAAIDYFSNAGGASKFYFYPQINAQYDVYESIIIPYAGINGNLQKNSLRSLSSQNPFIGQQIDYKNTNTRFNLFGGLKGNLSSSTSYDVKVAYSAIDNLNYFVIDYSDNTTMDNKFKVLYDNTNLFTVGGQLKYQLKEKIHFIGKGNYYLYKPKNLTQPYHRPDFDLTFSTIYNLKSKIILKADLFFIGKQWALTEVADGAMGNYIQKPTQLKGLADINIGAEYRYSKMLSFFVNFNNVGNFRYYRWEKYPSQRFMMMVGLTFVPF